MFGGVRSKKKKKKKMAKHLKTMGFTCVLINIEQLVNVEDYRDSFILIIKMQIIIFCSKDNGEYPSRCVLGSIHDVGLCAGPTG